MNKITFIALLFLQFFSPLSSASSSYIIGKKGMVVSTSRQASQAGIEILKKGGNAIDAAVAVGFTLAVTSPANGNLGGGGFLVAHLVNGSEITLDFREKAPLLAFKELFQDKNGNVVPNMSLGTHAASGVPGSVHGLLTIFNDYGSGKVSREKVLSPAIELAKKGFRLTHSEAMNLNDEDGSNFVNEAAKKIFHPKSKVPWKKGDRLIQKDLSNTLKQISENGINGFYRGPIAELIVKEMNQGNGLISLKDLNNYESKYRDPVVGKYKNHKIISMGPPSSGGAILINMLNMLEAFEEDNLEWNSADYIHLLTEIQRRSYADRAEHMGDSDFWDVPLGMFLSKEYAKIRIGDIVKDKASPSSFIYAGEPTRQESPETTHYSVIDKWGNAVSVTTTLNTSYGSGIVVDGAGFLLNNEMDDFVSRPGVPNYYGLVGNEANSILPGKRPLSSMTPTIVLKKNNPFLILGARGGSTIITSVMQVILNAIEFEMNIYDAISSPRFHSQWLPDLIEVESGEFSDKIIDDLKNRGHRVINYRNGPYPGEVNGIMIKDDRYYGSGDLRFESTATGY